LHEGQQSQSFLPSNTGTSGFLEYLHQGHKSQSFGNDWGCISGQSGLIFSVWSAQNVYLIGHFTLIVAYIYIGTSCKEHFDG
jgi:hypothetical protein